MGSIRGTESGPIAKPEPKKKGGKSPQRSGKRYERVFAKKEGGKRIIGSGAFGAMDATLKGDVAIRVGNLDMLLELKTLFQLDGRGKRTVTFPLDWLEKIEKEARAANKIPGFIYHPKGASQDYIVLRFQWFKELIEDYVRQIRELS